MSFSEKMRESLGAGGVGLDIALAADQRPPDSVAAGGIVRATVHLRGGTRSAHVDALVLRLIEADRYWTDAEGHRVDEAEAARLADRRILTPQWARKTVAELRVGIEADVGEAAEQSVEVAVNVPLECRPTSVNCAHTLNVQADIKGQIDPTTNARVVVRAG